MQQGQYWPERWNNHDATTHNLCLVVFYHLIAQADTLVNNWQHKKHDIASKNAVEIDSLQAYF